MGSKNTINNSTANFVSHRPLLLRGGGDEELAGVSSRASRLVSSQLGGNTHLILYVDKMPGVRDRLDVCIGDGMLCTLTVGPLGCTATINRPSLAL